MARRSSRFRNTSVVVPALLALALPGLAGCGGEALGSSYDLRWVGTLEPEAGRCPSGGRASMTMRTRDRSILFAPTEGVLVLHGALGANGTVRAALDASGAGRKTFPLRLEASLDRNGVRGTYTTPICRARVALHPAQPMPRTLFEPGNILGIGGR